MKKSTAIKILSLIVGVVIVASSLVGAFSVSAANIGTESEGVATSQGGEHGVFYTGIAEDYDTNGTFEKGLQYWTCTKGTPNTYPTAVGAIKTEENGNKYFEFLGTQKAYEGIKTGAILLPASKIKKGDKLALMFDYMGSTVFELKLGARDGTDIAKGSGTTELKVTENKHKVLKTPTDKVMWTTAVSTGDFLAGSVQRDDGKLAYYITVATAGANLKIAFDNLKIVKVIGDKYYDIETEKEIEIKPNEGDPLPPAWAGTVTDGMVFENTSEATYTVNSKGPVEANTNLDFHKGLMYWAATGKFGDTALPELKASAAVSYKKEGTRNYIQFDNVKRDGWCGIKSPMLSIPADKLSAGDQYVLLYDLKGDKESPLQFNIELRNATSDSTNMRSEYQNATELKTVDGWTTFATKPGLFKGVNLSSPVTGLNPGDIVVQVEAKVIQKKQSDACLSNFRIAKLKDNAYYDIYTGTKYVVETSGGSTSGGSGNGSGSTTGGSGTGASTGKSNKTGESITLLASLFVLSAAGVFGTAKALKKR